jgi:hypothetical protein
MEVTEAALAAVFTVLSPHLDERQRRLLAGAQARVLGRGGIAVVARAAGLARSTVQDGAREVDRGPEVIGGVRRPGAGRPKLTEQDPALLAALDVLVEPDTRGGPMSPLRWTAKSTRTVARELTAQGHPVSSHTVGELLAGVGSSLQATSKQVEGVQHPDRDGQFRSLNEQANAHLADSQPVISVDTKKQEVAGNLADKGRAWQPEGAPARVDVHDFPDPNVGKAVPFGVDDLGTDAGWVSVGPTMTPPRSRSPRSAAGGSRSARPPARTLTAC